jgi:hypothetical protein
MDNKNTNQQLQRAVVNGLSSDMALKQCKAGYFQLPVVPKKLFKGRGESMYYMNQKGKKVYLNRPQKERLAESRLPGIVSINGVVGAPASPVFPVNYRHADDLLAMARNM